MTDTGHKDRAERIVENLKRRSERVVVEKRQEIPQQVADALLEIAQQLAATNLRAVETEARLADVEAAMKALADEARKRLEAA